jgi:CheY-like chemotaxis protein
VEDAPTNQQLALLSLESLGYQAELAASGQAALDACERTRYAAILMDVALPGLDGYATTAAIRQREGPAQHTPIIGLTAHALPGTRERCLVAGMDDYLAKPVRLEELERVLRQWAPHAGTPRDPDGAATTGQTPSPTAQTGGDQAAATREAGVLDLAALDRVRRLQLAGRPDVAAQFGAIFVADGPAQLAAVQAALIRQDADGLRQAAHTLKGSAAAIGAHQLRDLCEQLEHLGRDGPLEGAAELGQRLEDAHQRARTAVQTLWIRGGTRCAS